MGGEGGDAPMSLCDTDCSAIQTPPCLQAVCNEGAYAGEIGVCAVVNADKGTECDDGQFCTLNDACNEGACIGGEQNNCGTEPVACQDVLCQEATQSCTTTVADNGAVCTPDYLCITGATCTNGICNGFTRDCFFQAESDCHVAVCNPDTGDCDSLIDISQNGASCSDSSDLCTVDKTCTNGVCGGGAPKNCSALTQGCVNGVCDDTTGSCVAQAVLPGDSCFDAADDCNEGICDVVGVCQPSPINEGMSCDDFNSCHHRRQLHHGYV